MPSDTGETGARCGSASRENSFIGSCLLLTNLVLTMGSMWSKERKKKKTFQHLPRTELDQCIKADSQGMYWRITNDCITRL